MKRYLRIVPQDYLVVVFDISPLNHTNPSALYIHVIEFIMSGQFKNAQYERASLHVSTIKQSPAPCLPVPLGGRSFLKFLLWFTSLLFYSIIYSNFFPIQSLRSHPFYTLARDQIYGEENGVWYLLYLAAYRCPEDATRSRTNNANQGLLAWIIDNWLFSMNTTP